MYNKAPLGEPGCLSNVLGYLSMPPALHPASQTCENLHQLWTLLWLLFLFVLAPLFWFIPFTTQSVRVTLVTYPSLWSTCVTYRTSYHASGLQVLFFLIGLHCMQGWTAATRHGVKRQRSTKRWKHTGNLFRKNLQLTGAS